MAEPNEVVWGPGDIWVAEVGTDFPDVDADPTAAWQLLGISEGRSFTDGGITIGETPAFAYSKGEGESLDTDGRVTGLEVMLSGELKDMRLASFRVVMGKVAGDIVEVAAASGTIGYQTLQAYRPIGQAPRFACLVRFMDNPYDKVYAGIQREFPVMMSIGAVTTPWTVSNPTPWPFEFKLLGDRSKSDIDESAGAWVVQHEKALP